MLVFLLIAICDTSDLQNYFAPIVYTLPRNRNFLWDCCHDEGYETLHNIVIPKFMVLKVGR